VDLKNGIGTGIIDFVDGVIDQIFKGTYKNLIIPEVALQTAQILWKAVRTEWGKTEDTTIESNQRKWLNRVNNNIYAFSAAKSYAQLKELKEAVFESDGAVKPFTKFRDSAKAILGKYNELWLETEYEAVKRSTIMGRQWLDIERDQDIYPFLEYVTAGDERVRQSHRALEGITLPVNSPFWKQYYPPNGWLCRCTVKKKKSGKLSDLAKATETAQADTPEYWRKNVGTSDIFEKDNTPYFKDLPNRPLRAVQDYGLHDADRISKRGELADLPLSSDYLVLPELFFDFDGLPIKRRLGIVSRIDYKDTIVSPDEVWMVGTTKHYIKYYKGNSLVVSVDGEGNITDINSVNYKMIDDYRQGNLHKKL
jgi:SPP1 gp7 family putative phage head morphogenesis protein